MNTYGIKVTIRFALTGLFGDIGKEALRNVTEVHYCYPSIDEKRVAFESDIHGTGITYSVSDIAEFEAVPETEIAEEF